MPSQDDEPKSRVSSWSWSTPAPAMPANIRDSDAEPAKPKAIDHMITHRHRLSLRKYPRDCPHLRVQWFHAVDIAKRRPNSTRNPDKTPATPKKYAAFSKKDSKAIEAAYQKLVDEDDAGDRETLLHHRTQSIAQDEAPRSDKAPNKSLETEETGRVKVPVNEDYLFDVDVEKRELGPAYWLGPVYDVRRGTWFFQEGNVQKPCDENLAAQLEEGYLKIRPWRLQDPRIRTRSVSAARRPTSWAPDIGPSKVAGELTPKGSNPDLKKKADTLNPAPEPDESQANTYRLFGAHMNSVVTYSDASTAWLSSDDFVSKINYNVYQRFGGGGHYGGVKLSRGFLYPNKKVEETKADAVKVPQKSGKETENNAQVETPLTPQETRRQTLERHMSYLLEDPNSHDREKQDEEQRLRDEREIEDDYREADGDDQGRQIEHLVFVTHGIGQRLGLRLESVNFVHDVNTLRKTLKAVYADSPDLRALNAELDSTAKTNCRVQVLPICWRHLLEFPKHKLKRETDRDSADKTENEYPSLEDISVEGVPAVRNLISDLALDILLYQSPAYKDHISKIVLDEVNRIFQLFLQRNPDFNGKVSMIGHSLGSAILFDILCNQAASQKEAGNKLALDFSVGDFYALGSPIGLFEMLKGKGIAARADAQERQKLRSSMDDPMLDSGPAAKSTASSEYQYSRPQCEQIFNIFHPTDPIAYRLEPLISQAMSNMKPQPLPYTKRGIFGAPVGQGLTGIGARVGQSVSSLWTSMSSGLASSLLTRGLGYTDDPVKTVTDTQKDAKSNAPLSFSAGTNIAGGVLPANRNVPPIVTTMKATDSKQAQLASDAIAAGERGQHPPTLIDQDLETLSSGYEKQRQSLSADSEIRDLGATHAADMAEIEERGRKLRREEEKVRRLNTNGRVDYAIQEGAFDINLLAAIASHLSYWGDEDVSHFMISQLLSRSRQEKTNASRAKT